MSLPLTGGLAAAGSVPCWMTYAETFSPEECRTVTALMPEDAGKDAGLVDGKASDDIRRTRIHWITETPETAWIYERLARVIARANREAFHFNLAGFDEEAQIGRYQDGGFYDWHVDRGGRGAGRTRKLTVSVQLTAPEDYAGGALELNPDGREVEAPRTQGAAIVFPAYALHRVRPVTRGVRHSLVIWTHGPDFV